MGSCRADQSTQIFAPTTRINELLLLDQQWKKWINGTRERPRELRETCIDDRSGNQNCIRTNEYFATNPLFLKLHSGRFFSSNGSKNFKWLFVHIGRQRYCLNINVWAEKNKRQSITCPIVSIFEFKGSKECQKQWQQSLGFAVLIKLYAKR